MEPPIGYIGRRLRDAGVRQGFRNRTEGDELPDDVAWAVRAFEVPALVGLIFRCTPEGYYTARDEVLKTTLTSSLAARTISVFTFRMLG